MPISLDEATARAVALGFNRAGVTRAEPSATLVAYERWVAAGMHAGMGYMARPDRHARRADLNVILPGIQSLLVVALDYRAAVDERALGDPARGRFAAYAWGLDYHALMLERLERLATWLSAAGGGAVRAYVDTGALLERSHAHAAGLGFVGKNTMLIHPRRGSLFFIGEILTTAAFDTYDTPAAPTLCGTCTRCLRACPTDAFPAPHVLDARRCISYWTIEDKGWIDRDLRPRFENWVYGCDVCQEVCPWQRFAPTTAESAFAPADIDRAAPPLRDLLRLDDAGFAARYAGSAVMRLGRARLVRNACIAAGNWGSDAAVGPLVALLADASPLVRGHAAWALGQIGGAAARAALDAAVRREPDEAARGEMAAALD